MSKFEYVPLYLTNSSSIPKTLVENQILQAMMAAPNWKFFYQTVR